MLPNAWRALNATQRDILVLLAIDAPRSGADLNRALGATDAASPVAYNALDALRGRGYVAPEAVTTTETTDNRLTAAGREVVREGVVGAARQIETAEVLG